MESKQINLKHSSLQPSNKPLLRRVPLDVPHLGNRPMVYNTAVPLELDMGAASGVTITRVGADRWITYNRLQIDFNVTFGTATQTNLQIASIHDGFIASRAELMTITETGGNPVDVDAFPLFGNNYQIGMTKRTAVVKSLAFTVEFWFQALEYYQIDGSFTIGTRHIPIAMGNGLGALIHAGQGGYGFGSIFNLLDKVDFTAVALPAGTYTFFDGAIPLNHYMYEQFGISDTGWFAQFPGNLFIYYIDVD